MAFCHFIPDNRIPAERAFYCCIPFFRPLSPHSPCTRGISRSGAPFRPQPPHGRMYGIAFQGSCICKAGIQHQIRIGRRKPFCMYLNGKQTGNLPCKPFQTSFNARLDFRFSSSVKESFNCHKITCFYHFSPHFCARFLRMPSLCQVRADTNLAIEKFLFFNLSPLCFFQTIPFS